MIRDKKKKIDALWMETRLGKCVLLIANGKREEAEELHRKAFDKGFIYGAFEEKEDVAKEILKHVSTLEEWREYIAMLDEKIVDALYETRALFDVDMHLM